MTQRPQATKDEFCARKGPILLSALDLFLPLVPSVSGMAKTRATPEGHGHS
jgi:hypothetical protein